MSFSVGTRKIYFGAGPAALPQAVLMEASEAVKDYKGSGISILEMPHRGKEFLDILEESKALVKNLCGLDSDHEVIWLQGGGRLQFAMVPMNFLSDGNTAAYVDSGHWSAEAISHAEMYGRVEVLASTRDKNYSELPQLQQPINGNYTYLHYTTNNTIFGTQWKQKPQTDVPLIADMSSDILSRAYDFRSHALIYAVAQKNLGAAGATLAIVRKDMLDRKVRQLPGMLDYAAYVKENSVLNTPPVFAIYTAMLMLRWTKEQGLDNLEASNKKKAEMLYAEVDRNPLFYGTVTKPEDRSLMNATFRCHELEKEKAFAGLALEHGIEGIVGHRSVGGFRASMYNAVTVGDVEKLVEVMREFEEIL